MRQNLLVGASCFPVALVLASFASGMARGADPWVVYEGKDGPGKGKHIVLVTGDEEYRSEEGMPMLARILAVRHGFKCTVLFAIDPNDGTINPTVLNNIPGLHLLRDADMTVIFTRFREPPDDQMKFIVDFLNSGKPILGLRTATHAFSYKSLKDSPYVSSFEEGGDQEGGSGVTIAKFAG